jgi:hypothetical protein
MGLVAEMADEVLAEMYADGIIPPEVVDSLPTLPNSAYPEGKIVYLTTDGKLYRNDQSGGGTSSGGWSAKVAGTDVVSLSIVHTQIADQIVAGQIAAAAVGADEIAANAIAVKHLVVADYSNIVMNGTLTSSNTDHWSLNNTTVHSYSGAPGGYVFDVNGTGGTAHIRQVNSGGVEAFIPVAKGESYFFSMFASPYNQPLPLYLGFKVWDASSAVSWQHIRANTGTGWTRYSGTITVSAATARKAQIYCFVDASTPVRWLVNQLVCRRASNAEMIVDGSITADKVGANEIIAQAANLKDAVVETLKIAGNAVTVPVVSIVNSTIPCNGSNTHIIQSTINALGEAVLVGFSCNAGVKSGTNLSFSIMCNSTLLPDRPSYTCGGFLGTIQVPVTFTWIHEPNSGNNTYHIKAFGANTPTVNYPVLTLLGCKR